MKKDYLTIEEVWMFFVFDNLVLIDHYTPGRKDSTEAAMRAAEELLFSENYSHAHILDSISHRLEGKMGARL